MNKKFGYTKFLIEGTNFHVLFKEFVKQNIKIKKAQKQTSTRLLMISTSKLDAKIVAILNEKCYTIIEKRNIFDNLKQNALKRVGLLIGICVGLLTNILCSFFVWNINMRGNGTLDDQILAVLKTNHISIGAFTPTLSTKDIEKLLYDNIDNLSLVSASKKGSTLFVDYTTKTKQQNLEQSQNQILAKQDGIVASILVESGLAKVKQGDFVKKGQVLVESDLNAPAKAQVFAYVFKSATVEFPLEKICYVKTDNYVENIKLNFLNSTLFETNKKSAFQKSENKTEMHFLSKLIPLKLFVTKTYELKEQKITQNFEENQKSIMAQAKLLAWELVTGSENILDEFDEINFVSNIYFVTHYIKVKEKIS